VFAQTYSPSEVIVIDDGSTDLTSKIKEEFPNISYIYQTNSGVSSARNRGITEAQNEWIAFLDSDDEWASEKLKMQVDLHTKSPELLISYTAERWIRDDKEIKIPKKFRKVGENAFLENLSYCNIAPSSVLMHKTLFTRFGLFDESLEVCEDYDLWLRIARKERIGLVNTKLIKKYAGHNDQLSFKFWGMDSFRVQTLEKLLEDNSCNNYKEEIQKELYKKYSLLLSGAKKHNRVEDIEKFKEKVYNLEIL
jgi:glycosyltransferase involved in cell wall biosynthesis